MIIINTKKDFILNRENKKIEYNIYKIKLAIIKALNAINNPDIDLAQKLTEKVNLVLNNKYFSKDYIPNIEEIQNTIEEILIKEGLTKLVKAYVLYRRQHEDLRTFSKLIDGVSTVDGYITATDWKVKENSNMDFSLQGLNNYLSTKVISDYWLKKIYPPEIKEAHEKGQLHIHDLSTLGPYCVGWDLQNLLTVGFRGVPGKIVCNPPKHLTSALHQITNFIYTLQGEAAGAQAFSNFDTLLAPFIYYDNLDRSALKKCLESFFYNMNVPTRVGFQCPFSNITLDLTIPPNLKNQPVIKEGKPQEKMYGEFQKELDLFNEVLLEVFLEGDGNGSVFSFPIPTINITKDFNWDTPVAKKMLEITCKYGIPTFANFVNSDLKPEDARSMCCRLRLDNRELQKRGGGLFGANPLTGSIGVVTINLPQLGYLSKTEEEYFTRLEELMNIAKTSLEIKRKVLERFTDFGLYPYSKFNLEFIKKNFGKYWKNHFSTIGILGMNESLINFLNTDITTKEGKEFTLKVMDFMRTKLEEYQKETGNLYNLEASPGEGTTYRFALIDKKLYSEIKVANEEAYKEKNAPPYYTNSTQMPVNFTEDIFEVLEIQDKIQTKYTGGTVLHIFIGEKQPDPESIKLLIQKITDNYELPYFSITPTFSICPKHGYIFGEHEYCPICDKEINYKG